MSKICATSKIQAGNSLNTLTAVPNGSSLSAQSLSFSGSSGSRPVSSYAGIYQFGFFSVPANYQSYASSFTYSFTLTSGSDLTGWSLEFNSRGDGGAAGAGAVVYYNTPLVASATPVTITTPLAFPPGTTPNVLIRWASPGAAFSFSNFSVIVNYEIPVPLAITATNMTLSGTLNGLTLPASSNSTLATIGDSQTLSSKTLSAPTLTGAVSVTGDITQTGTGATVIGNSASSVGIVSTGSGSLSLGTGSGNVSVGNSTGALSLTGSTLNVTGGINTVTTASTSIGNTTGTISLIGSAVNINTTTTKPTSIGNSSTTLALIGSVIGVTGGINTTNATATSIGNTSTALTLTGSKINVNGNSIPNSVGPSSQVLMADGSGNLNWTSVTPQTEFISSASTLSTTADSIISAPTASYTVILPTAATIGQKKYIRLANKNSSSVTVTCAPTGMGTFLLSVASYERYLRYVSAGNWALESAFNDSFFVSRQQGSKLVATGNTGGAEQGYSVTLSADGNTLAVGGPSDNSNVGAIWVWTRSGSTWTQQGSKLIASDSINSSFGPQQGTSVSLSADGNTLAVGGPTDNTTDAGAAWVYTRNTSTGVWTQQGTKLLGTGVVGTVAGQGQSVSLSTDGNTLAVGGPGDGSSVGAVWIWTRNPGTGAWLQQAKLIGTGNSGTSAQGWCVSLSADGNTVAVGGKGDNSNIGATWIFTRSYGTWSQVGSKLVGTGYNNTGTGSACYQGWSVSLAADGSTVAVGAYGDNGLVGAVWMFANAFGTWTQQGPKLLVSDATGKPGLGYCVALSSDGNSLVTGGYTDNTNVGAIWTFVRTGPRQNGTWYQQGTKINGTGNTGAARVGWSAAISSNGNTAVSGGVVDNGINGAVWVFI